MTQGPSRRPGPEAFRLTAWGWALVLAFVAARRTLNALLGRYLPLRTEYLPVEQCTKYLLLVLGCSALIAHRESRERVSAAFLVYATVFYLCESNLIDDRWRPLFGALAVAWIGWELFRRRLPGRAHFLLGCAGLAVTLLIELLEAEEFGRLQGMPAADWLLRHEEVVEFVTTAAIAFAGLRVLAAPLGAALRRAPARAALVLGSLALIASGNSWLHWQYHPRGLLYAAGLSLSALGTLGLAMANRRARYLDGRWLLPLLAVVLIGLPAAYIGMPRLLNLLLWTTMLGTLTAWLIRAPRRPGPSRVT